MSEAASHLSAGFLSRLHVVNWIRPWNRYQLRAEQSCSIPLLIPLNLSTSNCVEESRFAAFSPKKQLPTHAGHQSACWFSGRSKYWIQSATPCHLPTGLATREILNQGLGELPTGGA